MATPARSVAPTRANYERLKADCDRLRREVEELRETVRQNRRDLQTQFVRIAEMQAILDESRLEEMRHEREPPAATAVPLYRRTS